MKFLIWKNYFLANKCHFDHLLWSPARLLSVTEVKNISSSIQQFQRGEHSEGKHFLEFAKRLGDESYIETLRLFIKEEQDHAAVLGRFMDIQQIPRIKNDSLDNIFRWLRKAAGLEGTITVLLTAEIVAMIYYKALARATQSSLLRQICRQILVDEKMHLRFQSFTLSLLYREKSNPGILFSRTLHRILMSGTLIMVWFYHKKVLRNGGYNFFHFFNANWKELCLCEKMMKHPHLADPAFREIIINKEKTISCESFNSNLSG